MNNLFHILQIENTASLILAQEYDWQNNHIRIGEVMEEWKDIIETEGKYQISNQGRLRTKDAWVKNKNGERFVKGVIRKSTARKPDGYHTTAFYLEGVRWTDYIHRLTWRYFGSGIEPDRSSTIDHIDNNKDNNCIGNLRLVSNRDNVSKGKSLGSKTSRYTGVSKSKRRWVAKIQYNGEGINLGYFKSENQAGLTYLKAKLKYTGAL